MATSEAQIIRYDRTGTVSCQFGLKTDAGVLYIFLTGLGHALPSVLGYDPLAVRMEESSPEEMRLQKALDAFPPQARTTSYVQ